MITTMQDCENAIANFNLTGLVRFEVIENSNTLVFQIIRPKFKWFQSLKKKNFAQRYMWFMDFVERNLTLGVSKYFNLVEDTK